jgi:hypothetical protein
MPGCTGLASKPEIRRSRYHPSPNSDTLNLYSKEAPMSKEEREELQRALLELTRENDTKEKAVALFMKDGYFDKDGKLAREFRQSE